VLTINVTDLEQNIAKARMPKEARDKANGELDQQEIDIGAVSRDDGGAQTTSIDS
jgi:hypothetical protein